MGLRSIVAVAVLLASLSLPQWALACSCLWAGPFSRVAPGKDLIVLGEVLSYYKNSMEMRVIEVIKGTEERKRIRVWGDNGALCRPYVNHFPIGTKWLLALQKTIGEHRPSFWERFFSAPAESEYAISICGDFWIEVRAERAVGRITVEHHSNDLEWVPLNEMLTWLRSNGKALTLSPTPLSAQ